MTELRKDDVNPTGVGIPTIMTNNYKFKLLSDVPVGGIFGVQLITDVIQAPMIGEFTICMRVSTEQIHLYECETCRSYTSLCKNNYTIGPKAVMAPFINLRTGKIYKLPVDDEVLNLTIVRELEVAPKYD